MASIGPYRVLRRLGTCPAGPVWWGVDGAGGFASIAVLAPAAAAEPQWREVFAAASAELAPPQGTFIRIAHADFAGPAPWVACAADGGPGAAQVFVSLGMAYAADPVEAHDEVTRRVDLREVLSEPTAHLTTVRLATPIQVPGLPPVAASPPVAERPIAGDAPTAPVARTVGAAPVSTAAVDAAAPAVAAPAAAAAPVSAAQVSVAAAASEPAPGSESGDEWSYGALTGSAPPRTAYPPIGRVERPGNRRAWLVAGSITMVLVLVSAVILVISLREAARPVAGPVVSPGPTVPAQPSPSRPGVGPSASAARPGGDQSGARPGGDGSGARPADWPRWPEAQDGTWKSSPLAGTGLAVKVPVAWDCAEAPPIGAGTRHVCDGPASAGEPGGDVVVRPCPQPCDFDRQADLRRAEEAFGLTYTQVGRFATIAETATLDEAPRYALVVIVYYRSLPYGATDRQLVVRFTGPVASAPDLRKVANSAWDATQ